MENYTQLDTTPEDPEYDRFAQQLAAEDTAESEIEERRAKAKAAKAAKGDDFDAGLPASQLGLGDDEADIGYDVTDEDEEDDIDEDDLDDVDPDEEDDEIMYDEDYPMPFGESPETLAADATRRAKGTRKAYQAAAKSMRRTQRGDDRRAEDNILPMRVAGIRPQGFGDDMPSTRKFEAEAAKREKKAIVNLGKRMRKLGWYGRDGEHEEI